MSFWKEHRNKIIIGGATATAALLLRKDLPELGHWVSALFRPCPPVDRRRWQRKPFLVIGHRGAAGSMVENTIPSCREAMRQGANALEIDLCITRDNRIVVWHDWDPNAWIPRAREAGLEEDVLYRPRFPDSVTGMRRPVCDLTLEEFREHHGYREKHDLPEQVRAAAEATIPTLDEFVAWAVGEPALEWVFLDVKVPPEKEELAIPLLTLADEILARTGARFRVGYLFSHERICGTVCEGYPGTGLAFDTEPPPGIVLRVGRCSSVRHAIRYGHGLASIIHPKMTTIAPWMTTRRLVEHEIRLRDRFNARRPQVPIEAVVISTINEKDEMRCLIGMGADGIITDCPEVLLGIANDMGRIGHGKGETAAERTLATNGAANGKRKAPERYHAVAGGHD